MTAADPARTRYRIPAWGLVLGGIAVIALVFAALGSFGGALLPDRTGPAIEELSVERTTFTPGSIQIKVRNSGPDSVQIAQIFVNDSYVDFTGGTKPIPRLRSATLDLHYPWIDGQPYAVSMLTSTGLVIEHDIPVAVPTPAVGSELFRLMTLLGTYVGVIPVFLGMLVLPLLRRVSQTAVRMLLALTVGLLAFLAVDAAIEGIGLAEGPGATFGGVRLVALGAGLAYLVLMAIDRKVARRGRAELASSGRRLSALIAVGIGLHNLGEGLAIGSAYAVGELALGASLVIGFALHNTTEGVAIVTPLSRSRRPSLGFLIGLGAVAGAPAILGAWIGASIDNPSLSAVLLGVGVGAIGRVITQIWPALRESTGRVLDASVIGGLAVGVIVMYVTGLFVAA